MSKAVIFCIVYFGLLYTGYTKYVYHTPWGAIVETDWPNSYWAKLSEQVEKEIGEVEEEFVLSKDSPPKKALEHFLVNQEELILEEEKNIVNMKQMQESHKTNMDLINKLLDKVKD